MATRTWLAQNGNWTNTANWSGGAVPIAGDDVKIMRGDQDITTNLPGAAAGINYASFEVGPNFTGTIGSSGNELYIGTVPLVTFRTRFCEQAFINIDTGDTVSELIVENTSGDSYSLALGGPGTITEAICRNGEGVRLLSGVNVGTIRLVDGTPMLRIDSGASVTTINLVTGTVECKAAVTTVRQNGGTFNHAGDTTFDITTLDLDLGEFRFHSDGGTITAANLGGGTLNLDGGKGGARTITTLNQNGGVLVQTGVGNNVTITNDNYRAGNRMV